MQIFLEELDHQKAGLKYIMESFKGIDKTSNDENAKLPFANPLLKDRYSETANIDVKMETGTGKTYVYTRLMYEMHQKHGIFKFIIVVPSPTIKEGTKNFIQSDYAKQHFSQFYENTKIELNVINAGDFKTKAGRKNFPSQLLNFVEGSSQNANTIQVLLINAGMLNSSSMKKDDFDQALIGNISSPIEGLQSTRPVVIIDEPHRFPREKAHYKAIEDVKPQLIIRFGATFPIVEIGKGAEKITKKDYFRGHPQYDLNAVDSFNNGLVKGIDIYYPNLPETQVKNRYIVDSVTNKELRLRKNGVKWTLAINDKLSNVDSEFEGDVFYSGSKLLSNGLEVNKSMGLIPGTFRESYQELIVKDAIEKHFEIEQENFMRNSEIAKNDSKIKTLSLYFIDSIDSYRSDEGWLKKTFERLLKGKLNELISIYEKKIKPREIEYLDFLRATQISLSLGEGKQKVHAGYFGIDRSSGKEFIQEEMDNILKNKEELLSFKNKNGEWRTLRFLFSKWTLREGWDNPNVFVIAKLRTSGSENSKIQEVGRGLRLPVDERGRRVQQVEWPSRLAFLIGYDEKDFAKRLIGEINEDAKIILDEEIISQEMIDIIVSERQKTDKEYSSNTLLKELDSIGVINRANEIEKIVKVDGVEKRGFDILVQLYPVLLTGQLNAGKIQEPKNSPEKSRVKLKKENWDKVKELWDKFSNRYMLEFIRIPDIIENIAEEVIGNLDNYALDVRKQLRETIIANEGDLTVELVKKDKQYQEVYNAGMNYGIFVREIHINTGIPIKSIHKTLLYLMKTKLKGDSRYLNDISLQKIVNNFKKQFEERFAQSYNYKKLDFQASTSIYNSETKSFVKDINAQILGVRSDSNVTEDNRYLYESPPLRYDSLIPEKELLLHTYNEQVTVFGKLPRKAIQVPKYTGGSTTPDFLYVIEKENESSICLLVETKAENMRLDDKRIIEIQEQFFNSVEQNQIKFSEATNANEVYSKIKSIIDN